MQLGTHTANIIIDGKALEEFDVVSESPTKIICWVASEEGKPFSVQWKCHEEPRVAAALGCVYVDGIKCGSMGMVPGILGVEDTKTLSTWIDHMSERDLMFTRVQLCDDDSLLNKGVHKNLGEISLVIYRGQYIRKRRSRHGHAESKASSEPGNSERLHERSKKATVHCVGFGPPIARSPPKEYKWHLVCNGQQEITFVFKYQPLGVLQANGIAPRPNSTGVDVEPPADHTTEDIKPAQLSERIQGLENELKRLRDLQASSSEDCKPKRIKTEGLVAQRRLFAPGEIIDLT